MITKETKDKVEREESKESVDTDTRGILMG
jgi:hypothetical protein